MPKVSVNLVCYNHAEYVGEAIQSVLSQTFQDFEFIILDNGSEDNSLEVMKTFNDSRIKLNHIEKNQHSTYGGNNCVERGSGEYVALLCSDDVWEKDKLEKQVQYLNQHPRVGAVFTRVTSIDAKSRPISDKRNHYNQQFNTEKNRNRFEWLRYMFDIVDHSFCCSSTVIRRACLPSQHPFDIRARQVQDFILWANILRHFEIYIIEEKLTKMRYFNNKSSTSSLTPKVIAASFNEFYILFQEFQKIVDGDEFKKIFPETNELFQVFDEEYILFYLAMLVLKSPKSIVFKPFALMSLYDFLNSEKHRAWVKNNLNFTQMDLYRLAETHNLFIHGVFRSNRFLSFFYESSPLMRKLFRFLYSITSS